jgi:hypothetical protein
MVEFGMEYTSQLDTASKKLRSKRQQASGAPEDFEPREISMVWLCDNVFVQNEDISVLDSLRTTLGPLDETAMSSNGSKFVHVVNPYASEPSSEAYLTQRLTFRSMLNAKSYYELFEEEMERSSTDETTNTGVHHIAAAFFEDELFAHKFFPKVGRLERSSLEVGNFAASKKLPLLFEILDVGRAACNHRDIMVFTNSDICLSPEFYNAVSFLTSAGCDALIFNRRTLENYPLSEKLLPMMSIERGEKHRGIDCFVFSAEMYDQFIKTLSVIGRGGVMRSLLFNMVACAKRMIFFKSVNLTFHIGDDRPWASTEQKDYKDFNRREAARVLSFYTGSIRTRLRSFCENHGEPYDFSGDTVLPR